MNVLPAKLCDYPGTGVSGEGERGKGKGGRGKGAQDLPRTDFRFLGYTSYLKVIIAATSYNSQRMKGDFHASSL